MMVYSSLMPFMPGGPVAFEAQDPANVNNVFLPWTTKLPDCPRAVELASMQAHTPSLVRSLLASWASTSP